MKAQNKIKILTWALVVLGLLMVSTMSAFVYHLRTEKENEAVELEFYSVQMRGRDFRDSLNLTPDQMTMFRDININFRDLASNINISLDEARTSIFTELKKDEPDMERCRQLSSEIGRLHKELKVITCNFYMETREICDVEQTKKLEEMFIPIFTSTGGFGYGRGQGPGKGYGRFGKGWNQ